MQNWGIALALLLAVPAWGADLTRGITFTDGQRLTAANLHSLIDSASIGTTFLTGKSLLGTVDAADYVLIYDTSAGTFKKMTLAALLTGNTDLITSQSEEVNPAGNDYLLMYDASAAGFVKVSITNLVYNTNLIHALPTITNALQTAKIKVLNGGTNAAVTLDSLWLNSFRYSQAITNLTRRTQPTNNDAFLMFDSVAGTNRWATWIDLVTNTPAASVVSNATLISVLETNEFKQMTISNLMNQFANSGAFLTTNRTWTTNGVALSPGVLVNAVHGLGVTPSQLQWRLVMGGTTELGYTAGDEVDLNNASQTAANPMFGIGASATHVWLLLDDTTAININNKTTGNRGNITAARWTVKGVIRP